MKGYTSNIMDETLDNTNFRKVLFTGSHMQLVVMSLKPGEDIGKEVHDHVDQFFRVEQGECKVEIDENEYILTDDMVAIVPAGSMHNVTNTSDTEDLKLYTIYSPANHPDGTVHSTREEAMIAEEEEHNH
jgi:mannose-6-phosphate isomerase-like protein (cupin superfamily)